MQHQYWSLLGGVSPVFILIATGFVVRRVGWLTTESDQSLIRLTINLLAPCLIFDSILGNEALNNLGTVLLAPSVGFGTIVLGLALCAACAKLLPLNDRQARTFVFSTGIYNYGYIPVPLVQKFFGKETMGMLFAHNLGVEVAFWTAGIYMLTPRDAHTSAWKRLINAPVFAIVISLVLNFCHGTAWFPSLALAPIHRMGQSYVPVALLLTGASLADLLVQNHPRTPGIAALAGCVMRMLVLPVLFLLIARYLPCPAELKRVIVVQAAMPAAMLSLVLAKRYGGDADTAMQVVLATTAVGIVTIPFWIELGLRFVGA
ncbi:MAG TPA: AEC family transporter [Chthoniobacteraceae bacterium]|nr:AEC family transporter [Chthoniobacteraceae bacterium]